MPRSAACRASDPDALFVQGAAQNRAKAICLACPVRTECLADALDNRIEFGVWGGMTERERRALLRGFGRAQARLWGDRDGNTTIQFTHTMRYDSAAFANFAKIIIINGNGTNPG